MRRFLYLLTGLLLMGLPIFAIAGDSSDNEMSGEMPPMGPPPELQEMALMIGSWDVQGRLKMDPEADWMEYNGTSTCSWICGGAAFLIEYSGPMMGTTYEAIGLLTYDRENSEWQNTWTDNMAARTSIYTGQFKDGRMVLQGEDKFAGKTALTRMTTYEMTEKDHKWRMESSMDGGQSWYISMEAVYTKQ